MHGLMIAFVLTTLNLVVNFIAWRRGMISAFRASLSWPLFAFVLVLIAASAFGQTAATGIFQFSPESPEFVITAELSADGKVQFFDKGAEVCHMDPNGHWIMPKGKEACKRAIVENMPGKKEKI